MENKKAGGSVETRPKLGRYERNRGDMTESRIHRQEGKSTIYNKIKKGSGNTNGSAIGGKPNSRKDGGYNKTQHYRGKIIRITKRYEINQGGNFQMETHKIVGIGVSK